MSKANGAYDMINHFACNFAKYLPILKILSPANKICSEVSHPNLKAYLHYLVIYH